MRATRALIHLDRLGRNIEAVRNRVGAGRLLCAPVKGDAYGHGAVPVARAALAAGARYLAVAAVGEGAELRAAGVEAPILLLSAPLTEELAEMAALDLIPLIGDGESAEEAAQAAAALGKRLPVHLKIDTGMGRAGCAPEAAADLAARIASLPSLEYAGTATHLAVADSPDAGDVQYTKTQLERFRGAAAAIARRGINPGILHAANSGAVLFYPDAWFDMVRPGILLYGYSPAGAGTVGAEAAGLKIEPVMELRTQITAIKKLRRGEPVSYGRTWTATEDTWIGIIPVGYGDGLPRSLSGRFSVLIHGAAYPLAGRICMDQCMVNLGPATEIARGEAVTVFGGDAPGADAVAAILGTIPYEITGNINKRVGRVYVGAASSASS
jgi:alanine racemase